ncbi:MAG TPA: GDP-mannose 4,6-dehydratase [Pirellulales bacterium]|jgi:GDPmannose 4,6-dehydratase|nr:GDP-mannose 4,6-dehydratase [Pirellulales bacterium]
MILPRRALITGITGQDGSYLAELLLEKGYEVHGLARQASSLHTGRLEHLYRNLHGASPNLVLHYDDMIDGIRLANLVLDVQPDEIYNLAAQSHVQASFDQPLYTAEITALGTLRVLEAARQLNKHKSVRFYQASSSEMFGKAMESPQREDTRFHPRSPYACGKVFAHFQTVNYREAYGLFACCGILFNHESPRRGENFVTRKITRAAARIRLGLENRLSLGSLDAQRDWGYAKDYVEAMWLMLQQSQPDDFVIATGETHTVREFLQIAFDRVNLDWQQHVDIDPRYFRPSEPFHLVGDATKARQQLGWKPRTSFQQLAEMMVDADLALAAHQAAPLAIKPAA